MSESQVAQPALRPGESTRDLVARVFRVLLRLLVHLGLSGVGVLMIIPFVWLLSTSLKEASAVFEWPPRWIPDPIVWENYIEAWTALPFTIFLRNTLLITALTMVGQITTATMVAYSFARLRWPGRDFLFTLCISTMMLPYVVTLIPTFILFRILGWIDSFKPLVVPAFFGGGAFFIFLTRQFFMSLPYELDEAARIDGASSWRIWFQIMLPLSKPAVATMAIFSFQSHWNDFMGPLIYLNSLDKFTMALGLRMFQGEYAREWHLMMAISAMMIAPVLLLFFVAQNYFVRGIQMTGLAGR